MNKKSTQENIIDITSVPANGTSHNEDIDAKETSFESDAAIAEGKDLASDIAAAPSGTLEDSNPSSEGGAVAGKGAALSPKPQKTPKQKMVRVLVVFAFIMLNAVAIGAVLYSEINGDHGSFVRVSALFSTMGTYWIFIVAVFVMYVAHVITNALAFFILIRKCGYGNRFALSLKLAVFGKYYDSITPWNSGGQPFQMAYMSGAAIDAPTAFSLPVVKYAIRIFSINIFTVMIFIFVRVEVTTLIRVAAYIGLFNTMVIPLLLIIFSRNVPFMLKAAKWIVGILYKLKIVKNYDKQIGKAQDLMDSFLAAFKYLGKHKSLIFSIGILSIIDCIAVGALPYFIIKSFGGEGVELFSALSRTFYATLSSAVAPTPGGSGAAEGAFYSVFGAAVPEGYLFWAVLFWRFMVFYLPIIMGLMFHLWDWIKGKTKITLVKKDIAWRFKKTINSPVQSATKESKPL